MVTPCEPPPPIEEETRRLARAWIHVLAETSRQVVDVRDELAGARSPNGGWLPRRAAPTSGNCIAQPNCGSGRRDR